MTRYKMNTEYSITHGTVTTLLCTLAVHTKAGQQTQRHSRPHKRLDACHKSSHAQRRTHRRLIQKLAAETESLYVRKPERERSCKLHLPTCSVAGACTCMLVCAHAAVLEAHCRAHQSVYCGAVYIQQSMCLKHAPVCRPCGWAREANINMEACGHGSDHM